MMMSECILQSWVTELFVNSASLTVSCTILKPVNSTVSNQLLRVAGHYSDFSANQHAVHFNLTTGDFPMLAEKETEWTVVVSHLWSPTPERGSVVSFDFRQRAAALLT